MPERCPKCGHQPLPTDPAPNAQCPTCGVILAKARSRRAAGTGTTRADSAATAATAAAVAASAASAASGASAGSPDSTGARLAALLWHTPERVDATRWWLRAALLACFAVWGLRLIALDHRDGEIAASFLHGVLTVFHEAGHVILRVFGEWMGVLGGTLVQLALPLALGAALLVRQRDPFGAAICLWLAGVSLLDVAPYMYDARYPQLILLTGATGEDGPHDWIYLFSSLGWLPRAQAIGTATHRIGALVVLLALAWAISVLVLQRRRIAGDVLGPEG